VAELDAMKSAFAAFVRGLFPNIDALALYPCRVLAQNADGSLELQPDSDRLPGYSNVPLRLGLPGCSATVAAGARVLLGFENGEPSSPVAMLWGPASATALQLGDGPAQPVVLATALRTELNAIWAALAAHVHAGVTTGGGVSGVASVTPATSAIGSTKVTAAT
jgi:hypothetical protein